MDDTLLTPKQAADMLGVTHITLARWRMRPHDLPYIRLGGRIRYRLSHINAWLAKRTEGATPT